MLPSWRQSQELPKCLDNENYDLNRLAFVGWDQTIGNDDMVKMLFSRENLENLSKIITSLLVGVHPEGRPIVVPLDKISAVLYSVYRFGTRPNIGDIHSRYIVPQAQPRCDARDINNQTINIITRAIKDEFETIAQNKTLTVWTTVLGDFNEQGLRAYSTLKIRKKHPQYMAFNMNY